MADPEPEPDHEAVLRRAGAAALRVNAPMSEERLRARASAIADGRPSVAVDLGCGKAALLRAVAELAPETACVGIDNDAEVIARARALATADGVGDRVTLTVGDAAAWIGHADHVICVGASHALGGERAALRHLRGLVPDHGRLLFGDGVWAQAPGGAQREIFDDLPTTEELGAAAREEGWALEQPVELSTREEWGAFEGRWIEGVRGVGTPEAHAFADRREQESADYRDVLGFAWLRLFANGDGRQGPG